jgi:hypothetical protein
MKDENTMNRMTSEICYKYDFSEHESHLFRELN